MNRTIRKFGFGDPTQVELPGENPGIVLKPSEWSGSSLATISFGHGISMTPLAMVRAYAAIANGGLLLRPRIVAAIEDADGTPIYRYGREIERRVMSQKTAATLRAFLRAVVLHGTGNPTARVPGYTTAGKTGTAQMVVDGAYLRRRVRRVVHRHGSSRAPALRDPGEGRAPPRRDLRLQSPRRCSPTSPAPRCCTPASCRLRPASPHPRAWSATRRGAKAPH